MELCNVEDLSSFHSSLLRLREDYRPPYPLMEKVDREYRAYMESGGYYTWLALATRVLKPKRVLELGNYHGASTIMIYSELTDKTEFFYSVDAVRDIAFVPEKILSDSRVKFLFGNDLNLSIYGGFLPVNLDFLFIDTSHEYRQITNEWRIYKNLCKPGAIVILDDILLNDMPKFWAKLPYPKINISKDCHPSGFGAFIYQPENQKALNENEMAKKAYIAALDVAYRNGTAKQPKQQSYMEYLMQRAVIRTKALLNKSKKGRR